MVLCVQVSGEIYAFLELELEVKLKLKKTTKLIGNKDHHQFRRVRMFEVVRWRRGVRVGVIHNRLMRKKQQILWDGLSIYHRTLSYPRKRYAVSSIKQPSIIVIRSSTRISSAESQKAKGNAAVISDEDFPLFLIRSNNFPEQQQQQQQVQQFHSSCFFAY